jgi:hypothetical protein
MKVIKQIHANGPNSRQVVTMFETDEKDIIFEIKTKRLVDFKSRNIIEYKSIVSVETFLSLKDLIGIFINSNTDKLLILDGLANYKQSKLEISQYKNPEFYN